jgi:hypothetical protein
MFALVSPCLASSWLLTDLQFHTRAVAIDLVDSSGVHATDGVTPWDQILEISHNVPSTAVPSAHQTLIFRGGDHLAGQPVSFDGNSIQWNTPMLGQIGFPIDSVVGISRGSTSPPDLDQVRTDDVVRLSNGDSVHGIINQITATAVTIQAGDATPTLNWDAIEAVLFSTAPGNPASATRRMFRLRLQDNESITVSDISLTDNQITMTFPDKSTHEIAPAQVAAIEQLNGPITWLTSLRPSADVYRPFFSESFPTVIDRTVADHSPIRDKYPAFHHGIGCHSYSKLTYNLDGNFAAFRTQFVVDSNSPLADVTVRIYLDDKQVFEVKGVKAARIQPVVTVPLEGAKSLSLEVDYGQNYATEDRFIWLDPAFMRKLAGATTTPATAP